jgi:hypothetical protein
MTESYNPPVSYLAGQPPITGGNKSHFLERSESAKEGKMTAKPQAAKRAGTVSVAEFLDQQINFVSRITGKTQKDIAVEIGYDKPNIITMFKQGLTKVPINKVGPLAKAINVDPIHLLRVVMSEYSPDTWSALEAIIGTNMVSEPERVILDIVRQTAQGLDVAPTTADERSELVTLVSKWRKSRESELRPHKVYDMTKRKK